MLFAKPAVLLIHGAWHTPPVYAKYTTALEASGYEVVTPHLPTCNGMRPPNSSMQTDVATVRQAAESLVDSGRHVVMVMHSYGGAPGTNAVEGLSARDRAAHGLAGGIVHLVYMCAYMLAEHAAVIDIPREAGRESLLPKFMETTEDGTVFPVDARMLLLGGVPEETIQMVQPHFVRFNGNAMYEKMWHAAWRHIPSTYIFTTQDRAVPGEYQKIMTRKVKAEGVPLTEEEYPTSHSIFLTMTEEMVKVIDRICNETSG